MVGSDGFHANKRLATQFPLFTSIDKASMNYISMHDNVDLPDYGVDLTDIPEWNCDPDLVADEIECCR